MIVCMYFGCLFHFLSGHVLVMCASCAISLSGDPMWSVVDINCFEKKVLVRRKC